MSYLCALCVRLFIRVDGSAEVEFCDIVVERQPFRAAKLGKDCHDVLLLPGRELVLAMVVAIVRAVAAAEVAFNAATPRPYVVACSVQKYEKILMAIVFA